MDSIVSNNECSDNSKEKQNTDNVFKKPLFIGPRKVNKSSITITSISDNSVEAKEIEDADELETPEPNKKQSSDYHLLPYSEPIWKGTTKEKYSLEELKSGVIQNTIDLRNKSFIVLGRIDCCDIIMAHPTISRYHAVIQYRGVPDGDLDKGFYIYDLDSTHGTFLNKARLKPNVYARIRVGHMIKFGCSTRFFLLQGPEFDQEDESELTFTEMKEKRRFELEERKRKAEEELKLQEEEEEKERQLAEERGISWGLGEDADEEDDLTENPYAITTNEELYIDDPKKALRLWFEREGEEMVLETEQVEKRMIACRIMLPVDDERGKPIEVESSGRNKKEAQIQCALEACRIIDRMALFRQSKQEAKKRQTRDWEENDFYDSDEDSFLDRTGELDKKRQKRMKKVGKLQETVETYDTLIVKHADVVKKLAETEKKLQNLSTSQKPSESENDDVDALDAFMNNLKCDKPGKLDIKIIKDEVVKLQKEEEHLRKLINFVKPAIMPELKLAKKVANETEIQVKQHKEIDKSSHSKIKVPSENRTKSVIVDQKEIEASSSNELVIGPALPKTFIPNKSESLLASGNEIKTNTSANSKNKKKNMTHINKITEDLMDEEEDYTNLVWQPPTGQTGDGRTSLNEKFGY